jgi:hypothetical protein
VSLPELCCPENLKFYKRRWAERRRRTNGNKHVNRVINEQRRKLEERKRERIRQGRKKEK